jgi:hypothetical protein
VTWCEVLEDGLGMRAGGGAAAGNSAAPVPAGAVNRRMRLGAGESAKEIHELISIRAASAPPPTGSVAAPPESLAQGDAARGCIIDFVDFRAAQAKGGDSGTVHAVLNTALPLEEVGAAPRTFVT